MPPSVPVEEATNNPIMKAALSSSRSGEAEPDDGTVSLPGHCGLGAARLGQ